MTSAYPAGLDAFRRPLPTETMDTPGVEGDVVIDNLMDAIEAVQAELGTDPSGADATVKARLAAAEVRPWLIAVDPFMPAAEQVGTWADLVNGSAFVYSAIRYNSSAAQGDLLGWDVVIPPGTWSLDMMHRRDANSAIATMELDDGAGLFTTLGTIDMYASSTQSNVRTTIANIVVTGQPIRRRLRMRGATRNAASGGWFITPQRIHLRRTA